MKTKILQGTEIQFSNLFMNSLSHDSDRLPILVETRVYVLDTTKYDKSLMWGNETFMRVAEKEGSVYSLQGFQKAFNLEEINSSIDVIRIINVPI